MKSKSILSFLLVVMIGMAGCGGGGGGATSITSSDKVGISGIAVDGLIKAATVCIDTNNNNSCDSNEPMTTTDVNGNYNFSVPKNIGTKNIIVIGGIDTATNSAFTGLLKEKIEISTSDITSVNITPLTTVSVSLADNQNIDITRAKEIIANKLSLNTNDISSNPLNSLAVYKKTQELIQTVKVLQSQLVSIDNNSSAAFNHIMSHMALSINNTVVVGGIDVDGISARLEASTYNNQPVVLPNEVKVFARSFITEMKTKLNTVTNLNTVNTVQNEIEVFTTDASSKIKSGQVSTLTTTLTNFIAKNITTPVSTPTTGIFRPNVTLANVTLTMSNTNTDTDGDGMTNQAEIKYGYNPNDANSFPTEVPYNNSDEAKKSVIAGTGMGATLSVGAVGVNLEWVNPTGIKYSLSLKKPDNTVIYYGGHYSNYASVSYSRFNLTGTEILTGYFMEINATSNMTIRTLPTFTIDLSQHPLSSNLTNTNNYISYTFKDFNSTQTVLYRDFLKKVWPLMKERLGTPAESFNCEITNMGVDSDYFMIVNNGRTFLSDTSFIPRLLVHEFIHAWKGTYGITSNNSWEYDSKLSGFEEGLAEGYAFEIIQDYVKAYPNDYATKQLLDYKPHQYNSAFTNSYDMIKTQRDTGAGDFWTYNGSQTYRYSAAATTVQIIAKEYPYFYRDTQAIIYNNIEADKSWRPTRANILAIWKSVAPTVQGQPLDTFLDVLPVFKGTALTDGFYVLNLTRQYSNIGDQLIAISYVLNGREWWNTYDTDFTPTMIPNEVDYVIGADHWVYPDTQGQTYTYEVTTNNTVVKSGSKTNRKEYDTDGIPKGLNKETNTDLAQELFDIGMYKVDIEFTRYSSYNGAKESFYFFGYKNQTFNTENTNLMFGVDTDANLTTMTVNIGGLVKQSEFKNDMGFFTYGNELPKGYTGAMDVTVTNGSKTCTYKRTLLDAVTYSGTYNQFFVIVDKDYNCIEDMYE